jgi:uncharacterized membrane protein
MIGAFLQNIKWINLFVWAGWLTFTMWLFEIWKITPELVGGTVPWLGVEAARVLVGLFIINLLRLD